MPTNQSLIEVPGDGKKIQLLPIGSLKMFGCNPHGETIFRVVWSESRDYVVGADHHVYDGDPSNDATVRMRGKDPNVTRREFGYKRYPLYPARHCWILERWKSPTAATGCVTREQYIQRYSDPTTGLLTLGPFPERGEYYECFSFPSEPGASVVYDVIGRVLAGERHSYNDHKLANQDFLEKKEKSKLSRFKDLFLDAQQAFGNGASNIRPGKRTKEKIPMRYSAKDVGINPRGFSTK
jgi:hypothetical protein